MRGEENHFPNLTKRAQGEQTLTCPKLLYE